MAKVCANSLYVIPKFQTCFGVIPNPFRGHSKPVSRSFRTCFGVIPNLFQCHSELVSVSFRTCFGISTTQGQSTPTYHTLLYYHPDPEASSGSESSPGINLSKRTGS